MHFFVPKETPAASTSFIWLRRGSKRVIILFAATLAITVWSNIVLQLPPAAGMMVGLGLLQFFSFYLTKTAHEVKSDFAHIYQLFGVEASRDNKKLDFDVFKNIGNVDWDTLLFFYGAMMILEPWGLSAILMPLPIFCLDRLAPRLPILVSAFHLRLLITAP